MSISKYYWLMPSPLILEFHIFLNLCQLKLMMLHTTIYNFEKYLNGEWSNFEKYLYFISREMILDFEKNHTLY